MKRKKVFSLIMAMIMTITGFGFSACSNTRQQDNEEELSIENTLEDYLAYFQNKNIEFYKTDIKEKYFNDEQIRKLIQNSNAIKGCDFNYDGDYSKLYDKILNNSKDDPRNANYQHIFSETDEQLTDEEIEEKHAFLDAWLAALEDWNYFAKNNKDEDACLAQNLKIVFIDNLQYKDTLAFFKQEENTIYVYLGRVKNYARNQKKKLEDMLFLVMKHEFNHMRQTPCFCRIEKGQLYNFKKSYSTGIGCSAIESSAESSLYNEFIASKFKQKSSDYTYVDERFYEASLMLLNIFQEKNSREEYYKAIFDTNLQEYYNYFGATTEEEILDLYDMLFLIDALCKQNGFLKNNFDLFEHQNAKRRIELSYYGTLFNKILKEMIEYTSNNNDFTLEQNVVMFNVIKNIIANFYMRDDAKCNGYYDKEFMKSFCESEQKYVEFLSMFYNKSEKDIRELENNNTSFIEFMNYLNGSIEYETFFEYNLLIDKFFELLQIWETLGEIQYTDYETALEKTGISYAKTNSEN